MICRRISFGVAWCAVAALLVACGGKSAGSGGAAAEPRGCSYDGKQYADGQSFRASDGCNSCSCDDGSVGCSEIGCGASGCDYNEKSYAVGSTFVDESGSECLCSPDGSVSCEPGTAGPAVSCEQVVLFYDQALNEAKGCDPHAPNLCTLRVTDGLGCGCETFVNPQLWNAPLTAAFGTHYSALACGTDLKCVPCRSPLRGVCSVGNGCEDAYDVAPGRACKVDGTIYSDGSEGLPDPISCNTCTCTDGKLSCTDLDCPMPCPTGTKLATSCAQCGPTYDCGVVEYACRPTCADTCAEGSCTDGACILDCLAGG